MSDQRCSDNDLTKREIPSFIEPRPPLIMNPFMRPRPQKGTNLLEQFEEDSECELAEWVQVYLRMKPCNVKNNLYDVKSNRCLITSVDTATAGHGRRTQHNVSKMYTFSHIFGPESNQKEIFEHVVKDNLKKLANGHNFTLLTYGASGSGKTYTLMGTVAAPGLVPRSLEYVFRVVDAAQQPLYKPADGGAEKLSYAEQDYELQWVKRLRHVSAPLRDKYRRMSAQLRNDLTTSTLDLSNRTRYYVWVSFVEIYNEGIYDLLTNSDRSKATSKLRIREDTTGNVYVKGATQAFVRTGEEAYDVMAAGKHNLQVAATGVHAESSRSHCIFTITMLTETETGVRTSCVRLCDLAGSERARRTRNTGARMQESRAINSSLHVLERCLHMLRRKQRVDATLVPYRESKLTRLLGAGLSGSRGEAVSMVVTLNPAPEYAHETRHVLQLAAVAKDIQVNSTIAESTIEVSMTDTTVECSYELMKLRAENERLHFELVQSQSHNKKLITTMEENQQEAAKTMSELVEETKDMMRQYYESQLQTLRTEMEEMEDEYESRLKVIQPIEVLRKSESGTPSKYLQKKVSQLMTEIAILEEKLTAERLARARAEEEVQHLRACIEERDDKAEKEEANQEDVISVTDSESEEEDPCNESLEPTFKKENINRSRLLQQSLLNDSPRGDNQNNTVNVNQTENDSDAEISGNTLKDIDDSHNDEANSAYMTGDDTSENYLQDSGNNNDTTKVDDRNDDQNVEVIDNDTSEVDVQMEVNEPSESIKTNSLITGTYFVTDTDLSYNSKDKHEISKTQLKANDRGASKVDVQMEANESIKTNSLIRGTYFVRDVDISNNSKHEHEISNNQLRGTYFVKDTEISNVSNEPKIQDCSLDAEVSIAKDNNVKPVIHDKIANKIFKVHSQTSSDISLAQFEQLEKDSKSDRESKVNTTELFSKIKILKEKRHYFDSTESNSNVDKETNVTKHNVTNQNDTQNPSVSMSILNKEKKVYFDNIDGNICVNKHVDEIKKNSIPLDDRSPSIVKEDVANNFEPSTIKKLLGESITRQPDIISSVHNNNIMPKKPSVDIFEGFDSPMIAKQKENIFEPNLKNAEKCKATEGKAPEIQAELNKSVSEKKVSDVASKSVVICDVSGKANNDKIIEIETKLTKSSDKVTEMVPKYEEILDISGKGRQIHNDKKNRSKTLIDTAHFDDVKEKRETVHKRSEKSVDFLVPSNDIVIEKPYTSKQKQTQKSEEESNIVESTRKSIEKLVLNQKSNSKTQIIEKIQIKTEKKSIIEEPDPSQINEKQSNNYKQHSKENIQVKTERPSIEEPAQEINDTQSQGNSKENNTIDEFENIYKDITAPRATEFELLISQEVSSTNINLNEEPVYNLRHNLSDKKEKTREKSQEILLESKSKCESKPKRNLRLRKRKNQSDEEKTDDSVAKLKDIVNLQTEFCDVTLDVPAAKKDVKDIPSPQKMDGQEENLPPLLGIQSCPSKSVTRSRRKLFTPRPEPLEESLSNTGDSNERVRVPRPSYHRATRVRRKL